MTKTKYNTVESFPGTSIKSGRIKLVLWVQTFPLDVMVRSWKCFPHVSVMPTLTYNWVYSLVIKTAKVVKHMHIKLCILTTPSIQKLSLIAPQHPQKPATNINAPAAINTYAPVYTMLCGSSTNSSCIVSFSI